MDSSGRVRRILITTSRRPSPRVRSLVKDLAATIPGGIRFTRGHYSMEELAREALLLGADRIVVIGEKRGNPGIIRVYDFDDNLSTRNIVSFIVRGVALSRELGRPLPGKAEPPLLVRAEPGVAEEFAEAFMIAFHARIRGDGVITAVIKGLDEDSVEVDFMWRDRLAGPRLRLGRPARMIKVAGQG